MERNNIKTVLRSSYLTSTMMHNAYGEIIMSGTCPACGKWHYDTKARTGIHGTHYFICPNTQIKVIGVYA